VTFAIVPRYLDIKKLFLLEDRKYSKTLVSVHSKYLNNHGIILILITKSHIS